MTVHTSPEIEAKCPICKAEKAKSIDARTRQLAEDERRRKDIEELRGLEARAKEFKSWHDKIFGGYDKRHGR